MCLERAEEEFVRKGEHGVEVFRRGLGGRLDCVMIEYEQDFTSLAVVPGYFGVCSDLKPDINTANQA